MCVTLEVTCPACGSSTSKLRACRSKAAKPCQNSAFLGGLDSTRFRKHGTCQACRKAGDKPVRPLSIEAERPLTRDRERRKSITRKKGDVSFPLRKVVDVLLGTLKKDGKKGEKGEMKKGPKNEAETTHKEEVEKEVEKEVDKEVDKEVKAEANLEPIQEQPKEGSREEPTIIEVKEGAEGLIEDDGAAEHAQTVVRGRG